MTLNYEANGAGKKEEVREEIKEESKMEFDHEPDPTNDAAATKS